ncbi:hypothetical protein GCM10010412_009550 [Nonomuraea recticatena]|uniref:Transposase n=1 Tax=Nonomuraea recticatena TaxID=46178 RepID=A0ABN3R8W4_9ACTN
MTGIRIQRMPVTEWRIQACRRELMDRILPWNQHHVLRELETFFNALCHFREKARTDVCLMELPALSQASTFRVTVPLAAP